MVKECNGGEIMSKFLIIVDMQNDFINGSLGTKEAIQIVPNVCEKIRSYSSNGYITIFTMDTHDDEYYLETNEGTHWPIKHCIMGTDGHQIPNIITSSVTDKS